MRRGSFAARGIGGAVPESNDGKAGGRSRQRARAPKAQPPGPVFRTTLSSRVAAGGAVALGGCTMRRGFLLALLALPALACSSAGRRLDEANEARHAGRPRDALRGYQQVLGELGDGRLSRRDADMRRRALKYAADVSYLEIGDFVQAISYYRRIVALYPGTADAWKARATTGDIYRERFGDRVAAIAQWADIAAGDAPDAATYQLKVAREYLELGNWVQARTEARILRERWPASELADEAQLLTAQAWALENRGDEAHRAFQALLDRKPRPDVAAIALEGQAHLAAQDGKLDRALALYAQALSAHPSPQSIRMAIEKVRERRDRSRPASDASTAKGRRVEGSEKRRVEPF
jgi:tetratricopeptide (TPR) repeat protein